MNDLISVIVPAYNIEKYVMGCLDSILSQTYLNIEIIVVNDGSKDGTAEILDEYAAKHENVRVIHKENGGVTSARLRGVKEATGEWIGFVDGDDEIESDMYERLVSNAVQYDAQISHCGFQMIFPDSRVKCFHNTGFLAKHDRTTALRELLSGERIEPGLWNKLFHKSLFHSLLDGEVMNYDIKINEDLLMNFYLFREAQQAVYEDFCPYHYVVRESSATRQRLTENTLRDPIRVKELILESVPTEVADDARRAYLKTCIGVCSRIVREKNSGYENELKNARLRIKEKQKWIPLLSKKYRIYAMMILWMPRFYGVIYRFYFHTISKRPYD